ncbi:GEVED domain-containing protein [Zooshikella sp. RANM57]|uniref:GEVED domain-containing protein n=1 Tax=Zooshikella sp. RANM57 TaxID=3425863 RepID=UPI003D6F9F61
MIIWHRIYYTVLFCMVGLFANLGYAKQYQNYGMWNDILSPSQAVGRFQWLEKCYSGLLVETWERMYDATDLQSEQDKINALKNAWLYDRGNLKTFPQYLTFGNESHENPANWIAGVSATDSCKTIPVGYRVIGLITSFDFKEYCKISARDSSKEYIKQVDFGSFSNSSAANKLSNFWGRVIQVSRGSNYNLVVTPGYTIMAWPETWHGWIDWNRDGDFADKGEAILVNEVSDEAISKLIKVPANAKPGFTKMRITMDMGGGSRNPCQNVRFGEVEEYTIKIN